MSVQTRRQCHGEIGAWEGGTYYLGDDQNSQVCNFGIGVVVIERARGERETAQLQIDFRGETFGVAVDPTVFKSRRRFEDRVAGQRFGMQFTPEPHDAREVLAAINEYVRRVGAAP